MNDIRPILNKIYEFCSIKEDTNTCYRNDIYSNRLTFLISLLNDLEIPHFVNDFDNKIETYYKNGTSTSLYSNNLIMEGNSNLLLIAHHDIRNPDSENANDNSASILNAIALKYLYPNITVVLTDMEESDCEGVKILKSNLINKFWGIGKPFKKEIIHVVNLELTGVGEKIGISGYKRGHGGDCLTNIIQINFLVKEIVLPENECWYLKCFDSECISLYNVIDGVDDFSHFKNCHNMDDSVDKINVDNMERFVLEFLYPLSKMF